MLQLAGGFTPSMYYRTLPETHWDGIQQRERETERESLQYSHTSTELENPNPTFALCV